MPGVDDATRARLLVAAGPRLQVFVVQTIIWQFTCEVTSADGVVQLPVVIVIRRDTEVSTSFVYHPRHGRGSRVTVR
jgi:hypothetical protein